MKLQGGLLRAIVLVLVCALSMNTYAKGSSGSAPRSMSSGFKSTAPKPAPAPKAQPQPSAAPAAKTTMGSFGSKNTAASYTAPKTNSALVADMTKTAAQTNALKTLDSRKVVAAGAAVGVGAAAVAANHNSHTENVTQPAPSNSNFDTSGYHERAGTNYRSGYNNQPVPHTVVVRQDSGIVPAAIGYAAGQAAANANHRNDYNNQAAPGNTSPVIVQDGDNALGAPDIAAPPVQKAQTSSSAGGFFWGLLKALFYIAILGGIIYGVKIFLAKRAAASSANYSLGDM